MRTVWILCALTLGLSAAPSCAGKAESTDDKIDGGSSGSSAGGSGGTQAGGAGGYAAEGGSFGGSGPGGSAGSGGWGGHAGSGGAAGWAGAGGTGPGGSGPCGGYDSCPGNIPAIVCSVDYTTMLTCNLGDSCPTPTSCSAFCPSCVCHVAPPVSGNLLAGCDKCMTDGDCGPGLACKEDPALVGSGAKACVMK